MTEPTQTIIGGNQLASLYAGFGASKTHTMKKPERLFILMPSWPGSGKSAWLQSCPTLARLDFDRSGSTNPHQQGISLPKLMDAAGKPYFIDREWVQKVVNKFVEDAQFNRPRPTTIGLDTVNALTDIVQASVLSEYQSEGMAVKTFGELDGRRAYPRVYDWIVQQVINPLLGAGYGIIATTHFTEKEINLSGDRTVTKWDMTLKDGLYSRIQGAVDMCMVMEKVVTTGNVTEFQLDEQGHPKLNPKTGKPIVKAIRRGQPVAKHYLVLQPSEGENDPTYSLLVGKKRATMPDRIEVSLKDGWSTFKQVYEAGAAADGAVLV